MPILSLTVHGSSQGQDVVNTFWYRTTSPIPTVLDFMDYAAALAAEWRNTCWDRALGQGLADILPAAYTLVDIEVIGYGDDGVALSTTPYVRPEGVVGLVADPTNGAASYAVASFNLEPAFGPGLGLPKKGYVAIGPVTQGQIGEDGKLTPATLPSWQEVFSHFADNLVTVLPPGLFYPVRVKFNPTGLPFPVGFRDVSSVVARPVVRYRKSRLPEA